MAFCISVNTYEVNDFETVIPIVSVTGQPGGRGASSCWLLAFRKAGLPAALCGWLGVRANGWGIEPCAGQPLRGKCT